MVHNDQQEEMEEGEENEGGFKAWLEDNLRIILSVLVVFAIAGGIYSYSQRSQAPAITEETSSEETVATGDEEESNDESTLEKAGSDEETPTADASKETPDIAKPTETEKPVIPTAESKETETSFIESAEKGDGATHLARRALGNYLEKTPDSTLSKEHKIYIEDYLRKHVSYGHVRVGTNLEFSKSLIQEAIGKSKQLNDRQLSNLKKYSSRAPSLR